MKKALSIFLAVVVVLSSFAVASFAAETYSGKCGSNLKWSLDVGKGELVISGTGAMYDYDNANGATNYPPWYAYREKIKTITLGSGITYIGDIAFIGCIGVTSITIPDSVTSVDSWAFQGCKNLVSVTLGKGITEVPRFLNEYVEYIYVSSSNTKFSNDEYGVLYNKNKTEIITYPVANSRTSYIIPASVTTIGENVFVGCKNLKRVNVNSASTSFSADKNGVLFNKDKTTLVKCFEANTATNYIVPDTVTLIKGNAFRNCDYLTEVTIGGNVTTIDPYAFYDCDGIVEIVIPDSVASLGNYSYCYAFGFCDNLKKVTIGKGISHMGPNAFANCGKLETVNVHDGVSEIGEGAFEGCSSLKEITLPDSIKTIDHYAFNNCYSIKELTIGKNVGYIGYRAFYNCDGLTSIVIPDSVKKFGYLYSNVQYSYAFAGCSNLAEVTIGSGLSTSYGYEFYNCTNLSSVTIRDGASAIGEHAFDNCDSLVSIDIPGSITEINNHAFYDCDHLEKVTLGEGVKTIGEYAFDECTNLNSVSIPKTVTTIDDYSFNTCMNLSDVYYSGTEDEWYSILIYPYNDPLYEANLHFHDTHSYVADVTEPTCTNQGYTTYTCECGDSYIGDYTDSKGHSHVGEITTPATHLTTGEMTYTCECGDTYTEVLPKTEAHSYTSEITTPATHFEEGVETFTCDCGDAYTKSIPKTKEHNFLDGKCACGEEAEKLSSIQEITYVQQESTRKTFTVTCNGRANMIQFVEPDGGTRTYDRYNKNVTITGYNADGEVVNSMSRDLAYEVWEIYTNLSVGTTVKLRAKFNGKWEEDKRTLLVDEYNPVVSMELASYSGKKGAVMATVVADEKTEKVMFKMSDGSSVTVAPSGKDENGNNIFTGKAWMNEDGLNVINVLIRRKNMWKQVGVLEYTVK